MTNPKQYTDQELIDWFQVEIQRQKAIYGNAAPAYVAALERLQAKQPNAATETALRAYVKERPAGPELYIGGVFVRSWFGVKHNDTAYKLEADINAALALPQQPVKQEKPEDLSTRFQAEDICFKIYYQGMKEIDACDLITQTLYRFKFSLQPAKPVSGDWKLTMGAIIAYGHAITAFSLDKTVYEEGLYALRRLMNANAGERKVMQPAPPKANKNNGVTAENDDQPAGLKQAMQPENNPSPAGVSKLIIQWADEHNIELLGHEVEDLAKTLTSVTRAAPARSGGEGWEYPKMPKGYQLLRLSWQGNRNYPDIWRVSILSPNSGEEVFEGNWQKISKAIAARPVKVAG